MDNAKNNTPKKVIISTAIGIVSMILLIVGATYAYWNAKGSVNFNTATITYETEDKSIIVLNGTTGLLTLGTIEGTDMPKVANNIVYYAGEEDKSRTPQEVTIGVASYDSEDDENIYRCTFTLSLTHGGSADLIDRFLSDGYTNRSEGQIIITVNGVEYDINDGFPNSITGYTDVDIYHPGSINVGMKFVNIGTLNQDYLTETNGHVNINVTSFNCQAKKELAIKEPTVYWSYEDATTTNLNAQNKVSDYHYLIGMSNFGFGLFEERYNDGIFDNLSECEQYNENYIEYQPQAFFRCEQTSLNDYIAMASDISLHQFDTESECIDYSNSHPTGMSNHATYVTCMYDSSLEKWRYYEGSHNSITSSLEKCQRISSGGSLSYMDVNPNSFDIKCVHPTTQKYMSYTENFLAEKFSSMNECIGRTSYLGLSDERYDDYFQYACRKIVSKVFVKETVYPSNNQANVNNKWAIYNYSQESYSSLAACQKFGGECVDVNNYYVEYTDSSFPVYDTLSGCMENANISIEVCRYDNNSGKYLKYRNKQGPFLTEIECQTYLQNNPLSANETGSCVLKNYAFEYEDDHYGTYDSLIECMENLEFEEAYCKFSEYYNKYVIAGGNYDYNMQNVSSYTADDCNAFLQYAAGNVDEGLISCTRIKNKKSLLNKSNSNIPSSFNTENDCLSYIANANNLERAFCDTVEESTNSSYQLCGVVNDDLVCYLPSNLSKSAYNRIMTTNNFQVYKQSQTSSVYQFGNVGSYYESLANSYVTGFYNDCTRCEYNSSSDIITCSSTCE